MPLHLLLRSSHGMAMFAMFEIVPLWAIASRQAGGLALSETQLGSALAGAASLEFLFTLFAMARTVEALGLHRALYLGVLGGGATLVCVPLLPTVDADSVGVRAAGLVLILPSYLPTFLPSYPPTLLPSYLPTFRWACARPASCSPRPSSNPPCSWRAPPSSPSPTSSRRSTRS